MSKSQKVYLCVKLYPELGIVDVKYVCSRLAVANKLSEGYKIYETSLSGRDGDVKEAKISLVGDAEE